MSLAARRPVIRHTSKRAKGRSSTAKARQMRSPAGPERLGPDRAHLVDRGEAAPEPVARGAQVEAPDAQALGAGELLGALEVRVQVVGPVRQRPVVVLAVALDVLGLETGGLER